MIAKLVLVPVALLVACKNDKPSPASDKVTDKAVPAAEAGIAEPPTQDATAAAQVAPDAALELPPGTLVGKDPPTAESVHVELSYAYERWRTNPRDPAQYARDFGGRNEPDARVALVGYDAWVQLLPATPAKTQNATIKTWLDPASGLAEGESKLNVSYFYDKRDEYRELMWRREDGKQLLVSEKVNSRSSRDEWSPMRNWLPIDAAPLGKTLSVRFGAEGHFAWVVVMNDKRAQAIADLWPEGPCTEVDPPKGALGVLRCTNSGEGHDFMLVKEKTELVVRRSPAGKAAPMSTDRRFTLAPGAQVTYLPAPTR